MLYAIVDATPKRGRRRVYGPAMTASACRRLIKTLGLDGVTIAKTERGERWPVWLEQEWMPADVPLTPPGRPGRHRRPVEGLAGEIGQRVRELREAKGLTVEAAAERAGITPNQWRQCERGHALRAMAGQLERLARGVECEVGEVVR